VRSGYVIKILQVAQPMLAHMPQLKCTLKRVCVKSKQLYPFNADVVQPQTTFKLLFAYIYVGRNSFKALSDRKIY